MPRYFFGTDCSTFLALSVEEIIGHIAIASPFPDEPTQKFAWEREVTILKNILPGYSGKIYFEFDIPRMGKRIDVVLLIKSVIFVLEFKVGESDFNAAAIDQVWDYAIDLKNFHETSHDATIAPILIATQAPAQGTLIQTPIHDDNVLCPILTNASELNSVIESVLNFCDGDDIDQ